MIRKRKKYRNTEMQKYRNRENNLLQEKRKLEQFDWHSAVEGYIWSWSLLKFVFEKDAIEFFEKIITKLDERSCISLKLSKDKEKH